jgi:hypothetical protein
VVCVREQGVLFFRIQEAPDYLWKPLMGRTSVRPTFPLALLLIAVILATGAGSGAAASSSREYQVKAAFLYNFARFTEWPAGTFSSRKNPLTICIFGQDPFGSDLEDTVKGRTASDREILI